MHRRRFLRALVAGGGAGPAGCSALQVGYQGDPSDAVPGSDLPRSVGDVDLPVDSGELYTALPRDGIPAVVEPTFADDWRGLDAPDAERPLLPDEAPVVGVERDGRARAYPLRVLDHHEVANDRFGGPLLVSYCVQCGSAVVAERFAGGVETVFGVSGRLWRDDLVLYDRATESLWSQILAAAIRGPLTGERLALVPSTLSTWGAWRDAHPETAVLLPPPRSNTVRGPDATFDYFEPKYAYGEARVVGYESDGELYPRTLVMGVARGGAARAYPFEAVARADVVNDRVGGLPVVVTVTPGNSLAAYDRRLDGRTLRFEPADERRLRADGSRWERATGRAVDGPHEGRRLDRATDVGPMFWNGWSNFHPDTTVYEGPGDSSDASAPSKAASRSWPQ